MKNIKQLSEYTVSLMGHEPHDYVLLYEAFTHKSYAMEQSKPIKHNQRLEFLGDSVLGLLIADQLYQDHSEFDESQLTLYKVSLVREETLFIAAKSIWLDQQIIMGVGEERKSSRNNPSIVGDALEAFIGYIYLDFWIDRAKKFILDYIYPLKHTIELLGSKGRKSLLQEELQSSHKKLPVYEDFEIERNDALNYVLYGSRVKLDDQLLATGRWSNKKKAQEDAAKNALENGLWKRE